MTEKHINNHETGEKLNDISNNLESPILNHEQSKNESSSEQLKNEFIEKSRNEAEKIQQEIKNNVNDKIKQSIPEEDPGVHNTLPTNSYLKGITLNNELRHIQKKLNPFDKLGSQFIHQKGISKASNLSANTLYRPSGLLGGGILAFLGAISYYFYAKHVGITYNYLFTVFFFIAGFVIGLIIEFLLKIIAFRK
jgi:hypothetical protein